MWFKMDLFQAACVMGSLAAKCGQCPAKQVKFGHCVFNNPCSQLGLPLGDPDNLRRSKRKHWVLNCMPLWGRVATFPTFSLKVSEGSGILLNSAQIPYAQEWSTAILQMLSAGRSVYTASHAASHQLLASLWGVFLIPFLLLWPNTYKGIKILFYFTVSGG